MSEKYLIAENFINNYGLGSKDKLFPCTFCLNNISNELLSRVAESFREYQPPEENPIILFTDGILGTANNRWMLVTDKRMYIRLRYNPYGITVLTCYNLHDLKEFKAIYGKRFKDSYISINNKKIASAVFGTEKEAKFIEELVNLLLVNDHEIADDIACDLIYFPKEKTRGLMNSFLFDATENYFKEKNLGVRLWGFNTFYCYPFIPEENLISAREMYAPYDEESEIPIILIDNTVGERNPISGMIITNLALYYKLSSSMTSGYSNGKISLLAIESFIIKCKIMGGYVCLNKSTKFHLAKSNYFAKRDSDTIVDLMNTFIKELKSKA